MIVLLRLLAAAFIIGFVALIVVVNRYDEAPTPPAARSQQ